MKKAIDITPVIYVLIMILMFLLGTTSAFSQENKFKSSLKKTFKFATFYGAINGNNSISDVDVYSVTNGLQTTTIQTPFDYSMSVGVRKIARFGYENRANVFYDGTENTADASHDESLNSVEAARARGRGVISEQDREIVIVSDGLIDILDSIEGIDDD